MTRPVRSLPLLPVVLLATFATLAGPGCGAPQSKWLALRQIVLYQNGIGYFVRSGLNQGPSIRLRFRDHEVNDVLKTLAVLDPRSGARTEVLGVSFAQTSASQPEGGGGRGDATASESAGTKKASEATTVPLELSLGSAASRELVVSYAVQVPAWKATYRVVLPEGARGERAAAADGAEARALLQAWALVENLSGEDWMGVRVRLDTSAPLSFATDLRTPRFVARPDATKQLIGPPVALAPTTAEIARGEADRDHDGIPDSLDACPDEPETYNGFEDEDGCPDKGRVIVHTGRIEIIDKIYFARNEDRVKPISRPILDAIASTLKGNPQITSVEVQGFASEDEDDPFGLSARRAAAVRLYLALAGVKTELRVVPFGASRPLAGGGTEETRARNRRVELQISKRERASGGGSPTPTAAGGAAGGGRADAAALPGATLPSEAGSSAGFAVTEPLDLPRGASYLVSIIDRPVPGEESFLFRPDPAVPGSELHPFRCARLVNDGPVTLVPGPVAILARGGFVGEGLLERLHPGESAFIPFALDRSADIRVEVSSGREPARLLSVVDGVARVESRDFISTRYAIATGKTPPARLFLRHARTPGHEALGLPPRSEVSATSTLIPVPLAPSRAAVFVVREERAVAEEIRLHEEGAAERLALYPAVGLPAESAAKLREVIDLQRGIDELAKRVAERRELLGDLASESTEVRQSLVALARAGGSAALRAKLLERLKVSGEKSAKESTALDLDNAALLEARARVRQSLRSLRIAR
jgi:outer membrane protein OmpA-like peptidoglycan-associated protein